MENYNFDFSLLDLEYNIKNNLHSDTRTPKTTEQCLLCNKFRKTFYCKRCVKNGDFIHSTSRYSERFAEKRMRLLRLQNEKNILANEFNRCLQKPRLVEDKIEDIRGCKERIQILKLLVSDTKKNINIQKKVLADLLVFNKKGKHELEKNESCQEELKGCVDRIHTKRSLLSEQLSITQPLLKQYIRRRIQELRNYIFPIEEVQLSKSYEGNTAHCSESTEEIKNELAEATRTAYVRGRWIFTDSWGGSYHSIVAPTLPDSGDYSAYISWVLANKEALVPMTNNTSAHHNPAHSISAALTFVTQLVNLVAFYLDIRLPNTLYYSEFCGKLLNERRFIKYVTQLNANILFLCLSQNIDPSYLHPTHTIRNLLLLMDRKYSDLGSQDVIEIDGQCISYFEEQLSHLFKEIRLKFGSDYESQDDGKDNCDSDVGTIDEDYDSDYLAVEWEALPLVPCPEASPGSMSSRSSRSSISGVQTTSIAGGLMNSAAASLASIWRGWTAHK